MPPTCRSLTPNSAPRSRFVTFPSLYRLRISATSATSNFAVPIRTPRARRSGGIRSSCGRRPFAVLSSSFSCRVAANRWSHPTQPGVSHEWAASSSDVSFLPNFSSSEKRFARTVRPGPALNEPYPLRSQLPAHSQHPVFGSGVVSAQNRVTGSTVGGAKVNLDTGELVEHRAQLLEHGNLLRERTAHAHPESILDVGHVDLLHLDLLGRLALHPREHLAQRLVLGLDLG